MLIKKTLYFFDNEFYLIFYLDNFIINNLLIFYTLFMRKFNFISFFFLVYVYIYILLYVSCENRSHRVENSSTSWILIFCIIFWLYRGARYYMLYNIIFVFTFAVRYSVYQSDFTPTTISKLVVGYESGLNTRLHRHDIANVVRNQWKTAFPQCHESGDAQREANA